MVDVKTLAVIVGSTLILFWTMRMHYSYTTEYEHKVQHTYDALWRERTEAKFTYKKNCRTAELGECKRLDSLFNHRDEAIVMRDARIQVTKESGAIDVAIVSYFANLVYIAYVLGIVAKYLIDKWAFRRHERAFYSLPDSATKKKKKT